MSADPELDAYADLTARTLDRFFSEELRRRGITNARSFVDQEIASMTPIERHWLYHDEPIGTAGLLVGHEPADWQNAHPEEMAAYFAEIAPERDGRFPDAAGAIRTVPEPAQTLTSEPPAIREAANPTDPVDVNEPAVQPQSPGAVYQEILTNFDPMRKLRVPHDYMLGKYYDVDPYIRAFAAFLAYKSNDRDAYEAMRDSLIARATAADVDGTFFVVLQKFADRCAEFDKRFRGLSGIMATARFHAEEERLREEADEAFRSVTGAKL